MWETRETWVGSWGQEDPLEEGIATHSSILAWRIPKDRGAWQATVHRVKRVGRNWATKYSTAQHSLSWRESKSLSFENWFNKLCYSYIV